MPLFVSGIIKAEFKVVVVVVIVVVGGGVVEVVRVTVLNGKGVSSIWSPERYKFVTLKNYIHRILSLNDTAVEKRANLFTSKSGILFAYE